MFTSHQENVSPPKLQSYQSESKLAIFRTIIFSICTQAELV